MTTEKLEEYAALLRDLQESLPPTLGKITAIYCRYSDAQGSREVFGGAISQGIRSSKIRFTEQLSGVVTDCFLASERDHPALVAMLEVLKRNESFICGALRVPPDLLETTWMVSAATLRSTRNPITFRRIHPSGLEGDISAVEDVAETWKLLGLVLDPERIPSQIRDIDYADLHGDEIESEGAAQDADIETDDSDILSNSPRAIKPWRPRNSKHAELMLDRYIADCVGKKCVLQLESWIPAFVEKNKAAEKYYGMKGAGTELRRFRDNKLFGRSWLRSLKKALSTDETDE